jgi:sugar lactone lactonase YvrE
MKTAFTLVCFTVLVPLAYADSGGFSNSGGSLGGGTPVANPPGILTIANGALTFASTDGSTVIQATFLTSSTVESCSGGGRGGHITCTYTFTGTFSGTLTLNGSPQAINGSTYQLYESDGVIDIGLTGYNSAYTPFYFANSGQILRSDDLNGTNLITYGTQGSRTGQFYGSSGIALDNAGRIYVADSYNGRIVRIDDMKGTNWTTYGSWGSGVGQFMDLSGLSIDSAGKIYIMDTGNNRLVRIDDMTGKNWTTMTGIGSGAGQFAQYAASVAFDASGRIYVADTGNRRIVRMDDMNATNWTTLTQSPVINGYIFSFGSPVGVAVDASGHIYVADQTSPNPLAIRVDDMTGANWTSISLGASATPHSIAVDASGMVLVGGGGAQIVDNMSGALVSSSALTQAYGPYYVWGATPLRIPSPPPPAIIFSPTTLSFSQSVGTTSPAQTITVTNFGGQPLHNLQLSATGPFSATSNCPAMLIPATNCTISVTFTPVTAGPAAGALNITDDSGNLGSTQTLALTGIGTIPVTIAPNSLSFGSVRVGGSSVAKKVTLTNQQNIALAFSNITVSAGFAITSNTCGTGVAAGATCSVSVKFTPTAPGDVSGALAFTDDAANSPQVVTLSGTGTSGR